MEDKHRSLTDVFRFIDQRGKGKVRKMDFMAAVERMRISLSREDVTKVWNYIDAQQLGYISMQELSLAYANRVSNFNK
jgi:Ca2+-binding EF-hand superfamily protein